jgi:hypothetical protein
MTDNEQSSDGVWADPLSRSERSMVAGMLARAAKRLHHYRNFPLPSHVGGASCMEDARRMGSYLRASAEMSDLRLDVTERADPARATTECRVHGEVPDDHFPCRAPGETAGQFTNRYFGYWRDV